MSIIYKNRKYKVFNPVSIGDKNNRTDPRFIRFTCLDTAAGMVMRERKVQWSSVGWGQEQSRGQGAEATTGKVNSAKRAWRTDTAAGSIFIRRGHSCPC